MEALKPIVDRTFYHKGIQKMLEKFWWDNFFQPLYDIVREDLNVRLNSKGQLLQALRKGKIQYKDGYFTGIFNAGVSKDLRSLGASWDKWRKAFYLDKIDIPMDVKAAIGYSEQRIKELTKRVFDKADELSNSEKRMPELDFTTHFEKITKDLEGQWKKTVKPKINVPLSLTPEQAKALSKAYSENLNYYRDEWSKQQAERLKTKITKTILEEGYRSDKLVKYLKAEFGITQNKAKFLARQETSLLVSKYRQVRYESVGLDEYKWSTSHDERVREDHKVLDYTYRMRNGLKPATFKYSDPPITDKATGKRNNPGEDFNCRCVAIPIVRF